MARFLEVESSGKQCRNKRNPTQMYLHLYFISITEEHICMSPQSQGGFVSMQKKNRFFWVGLYFEICVTVLIYFAAFQESG